VGRTSECRVKPDREKHKMAPYGTFNEEALAVWDFARCQRPDGSIYGTKGKCRKGTEIGAEPEESKGMSRASLPEYWQDRAEFSESRYDKKLEQAMTTHTGEKPPALVEQMKPYTKLSGDEKASIQMYGAAGVREQIYDEMNRKLRTGKEPSEDKKEAVEFTTQHLNNALDKLPDTQGEFYRAVASENVARALSGLSPGDVLVDKGFGSYSDSGGPNISPFFDKSSQHNVVMIVQGKKFKNVSPVMPYQEGEHLSKPGTQLKLVKVDPQGFQHRKIGYVPTYYFEEV
jgi:hypothetical protein